MKPTIECKGGLLCGTDNCWGTNFVASTDCCFQPGKSKSKNTVAQSICTHNSKMSGGPDIF